MINEHVYLMGPALVLVPYLTPFVPRYHEWMCDPALLAATESDPLSLEEEHENQVSWLESTDKMTFILLAPLETKADADQSTHPQRVSLKGAVPPLAATVAASPTTTTSTTTTTTASAPPAAPRWAAGEVWYPGSIVTAKDYTRLAPAPQDTATSFPLTERFAPSHLKPLFPTPDAETGPEPRPPALATSYVMTGDCNLFLLDEDDDEEEGTEQPGDAGAFDWSAVGDTTLGTHQEPRRSKTATAPTSPSRTFEVEVMVADTTFRRRGLAEAAVRMLMQYAVAVCGATRFVAKILDSNAGSIALFTHRLGFAPFKEVKVFHEIHYVRSIKTASERLAWEAECAERCRSAVAKGPEEEPSGAAATSSAARASHVHPVYWCAPLDDAAASSMLIFARAP